MSDTLVLEAADTQPVDDAGAADGDAPFLATPLRVSLQELKDKSPTDLVAYAEALEIENASSLRKQDMLFAILKTLADEGTEITGSGVLEVLQDGFGFLRSPEANYLPVRTTSMSRRRS
jgi:transcription termination factor Rho